MFLSRFVGITKIALEKSVKCDLFPFKMAAISQGNGHSGPSPFLRVGMSLCNLNGFRTAVVTKTSVQPDRTHTGSPFHLRPNQCISIFDTVETSLSQGIEWR